MNLLARAIITGFGLKIGAEVAKFVSARVRKIAEDREGSDDEDTSDESPDDDDSSDDDDMPTTIPPDPPLI